MTIPISQAVAVARHVLWNKARRVRRYPLVLMLEPLFRCNLACPGCGKIEYPVDVLKRHLTPEQCFAAAEQCRAPIVSIAGGEPLLHPRIDQIVAGLVERKKYVYLCTNALQLEESLRRFAPTKRLVLSVHLDGPPAVHDRAVGREGVYDIAVQAMRVALGRGFRVTTNVTLFHGVEPAEVCAHFDSLMALGIEGMTVAPGYRYADAQYQELFLARQQTEQLFQQVLQQRKRNWRFNQTPVYLEFLQGRYELPCTPWGNPTYNVFGWQIPCYLVNDGYCDSFQQLLVTTRWEEYGQASGNSNCRDCMMHCGHEPSAVQATLGSWRGMWTTLRWLSGRTSKKGAGLFLGFL